MREHLDADAGEARLGAEMIEDLVASIHDIAGRRRAAYGREARKAGEIAFAGMVKRVAPLPAHWRGNRRDNSGDNGIHSRRQTA